MRSWVAAVVLMTLGVVSAAPAVADPAFGDPAPGPNVKAERERLFLGELKGDVYHRWEGDATPQIGYDVFQPIDSATLLAEGYKVCHVVTEGDLEFTATSMVQRDLRIPNADAYRVVEAAESDLHDLPC